MYLTWSTAGALKSAKTPIFDGLDDLAAMPVNTFELFGFPEHIDVSDAVALNRLLDELGQRGLHIQSIHAPSWGAGGVYDLSSLDEATRDKAVHWHQATLRAARLLGAGYITIHGGDRIEEPDQRPRHIEAAIQSIGRLVPLAEQLEVTIALENILDPYLPRDLSEAVALVEGVDSERFRMIFDIGHAFLSDGLDAWLARFDDFPFCAVHATDNHGRVRNTSNDDEHLFPGRGIIPWEEVIGEVHRLGFDGPLTIECALDDELYPWFHNLVVRHQT